MEYTTGSKVLDGWEIVRPIGAGSYGKVFEVRKTSYGVETVSALKVIRIPESPAEVRSALNDGMAPPVRSLSWRWSAWGRRLRTPWPSASERTSSTGMLSRRTFLSARRASSSWGISAWQKRPPPGVRAAPTRGRSGTWRRRYF